MGIARDMAARLKVSAKATEMMEEAGLGDLPVLWNPRLRRVAGRCHWGQKRGRIVAVKLDLNVNLRKEGPEWTRNTFLHELAHAIAGVDAGHSDKWRDIFLALGGNGERHHKYESMKTKVKIVGYCPGCEKDIVGRRHLNFETSSWICGGCGTDIDRPVKK